MPESVLVCIFCEYDESAPWHHGRDAELYTKDGTFERLIKEHTFVPDYTEDFVKES